MNGTVQVWELSLAAVFLLAHAVMSLRYRLLLERRLIVAGVRCVLQLLAMGLVLRWLFEADRWWFLFPVLLLMVVAASQASLASVTRRPAWARTVVFSSLLGSSAVVAAPAVLLLLHADPWYAPHIWIPVVGMLLGNALTGISLGLRELFEGLERERDRIEFWLTLGASRQQASRHLIRSALGKGLIPIVNSMSVAGLVSIPGMMTGQILAGASPMQAAKMQILILFLIAGCTALGLGASVFMSLRFLFDEHDCPRRLPLA